MTGAPATYGSLHAGDWVIGADGEVWGVAQIVHVPHLEVVLVRDQWRVTGYPAPGTPVTVVHRADVSAMWHATQCLIDRFGEVQLLGERWGPSK